MKFVPEQVQAMAQKIAPAADATREHAKTISDVGFQPGHTGQDYLEQGKKLAAGIDGIVGMLQSWSDASAATAAALQHAVTQNVSTDDRNSARINAAATQQGPA